MIACFSSAEKEQIGCWPQISFCVAFLANAFMAGIAYGPLPQAVTIAARAVGPSMVAVVGASVARAVLEGRWGRRGWGMRGWPVGQRWEGHEGCRLDLSVFECVCVCVSGFCRVLLGFVGF